MSFKKLFYFFILTSLITFFVLKEKTPHTIFEAALAKPQSSEAAAFCSAISKLDDPKDAYEWGYITTVFSTQDDSNISCYIALAAHAGDEVEKRLKRYASKVFRTAKQDEIETLLRNGFDPDFDIKVGEQITPTDVYYSKRNGTKVVEVEETKFQHMSGKGGNQLQLSTGTKKVEVPRHQFLGSVSLPDGLKSRQEVALYLRAEGYPDNNFTMAKFYSAVYVKPLDIAVNNSNIALIETLLEYGADISASRWAEKPVITRRDAIIYPRLTLQQQDWSTLEQIIIKDDLDRFKTALATTHLNKMQLTAIIDSVFTHQSPKILATINSMEQFSFIYQQPDYLIRAYQTGNVDILNLMIDGGADLNALMSLRKLPTSFVHLSHHYEQFKDKDIKKTVADFMVAHAQENKSDELAQAIESHRYHWSPIHFAAIHEDSKLIEQLIEINPALIEHADNHGQTPLMLAVKYQRNDIIEKLLAQGADLTRLSKDGKTALMYAIDTRNERAVSTFLQNDATFTANNTANCIHLASYVKGAIRQQYFFPQLYYSPDNDAAIKERKRLMIINKAYLRIIEKLIVAEMEARQICQ